MTSIALRNLAFGLPPLEQLQKEVAFANMKEPEAQAAHEENLKAEVGHDELWTTKPANRQGRTFVTEKCYSGEEPRGSPDWAVEAFGTFQGFFPTNFVL